MNACGNFHICMLCQISLMSEVGKYGAGGGEEDDLYEYRKPFWKKKIIK